MQVYTYNPSALEAEAKRLPQLLHRGPSEPELQSHGPRLCCCLANMYADVNLGDL